MSSFVGRTIIFMQHKKRNFVEKMDYLTSPGWLSGADQRIDEGLPGGRPEVVITNMAVMGFDAETREIYLKSYFPGIKPEAVLDNMGYLTNRVH